MSILSKIFGSSQSQAAQAGASGQSITTITGTATSSPAGSVYYNTASNTVNVSQGNGAWQTTFYTCPNTGIMAQTGTICSCGQCIYAGGIMMGGSGQYLQMGGAAGGLVWGGVTLTPEELKELADLEQQHKENTRLFKMGEFKKIPSALRQQVVDVIIWQEESTRIGSLEDAKSQRHIDLEAKRNNNGSMLIGGTSWFTHSNFAYVPTINGLTANDLKQAHLEACAEEALTGDDTESK